MKTTESWNRRVLIVDDQEEIHRDFEEMLALGATAGASDAMAEAFILENRNTFLPDFELFHATSGEEAYAMVTASKTTGRPFAIAYIDIRMPPGIDGVETIRQIRKIEQHLEVVIMTAYTDKALPEVIHDMALLHKLLYIRKPFAREEIQQITLSLVEKWNVERELEEKQRQLVAGHQRLEAVLDATGDAIGMFDVNGRLLVANHWYEKLYGATESQLRTLTSEALAAHRKARFRAPTAPVWSGSVLSDGTGSVVEEVPQADAATPRLFYRSTAPVQDGQQALLGHLVIYRDVSKEVEIEQMKAEVSRLRTALEAPQH